MTEIARRSAVNDDYCTQALQAALELSMLNISGGGSSRSNVDVLNVPELQESKSLNVTECVAVPSSEHVAEIVGRQGQFHWSDRSLIPKAGDDFFCV